MSTYELKTNIRQTVTIWIGVLSLLIGLPLYGCSNSLIEQINTLLPNASAYTSQWAYLGIFNVQITAGLIFSFLNWLFNNYIWKLPIFIKVLKIPNLNGVWEGKLESSYMENGEYAQREFTLEVQQTWTKISCTCFFPKSKSYSDIVCIDTTSTQGTVIKYTYKNVSEDLSCGMPEFSGYNELRVNDANTLSGVYFTKREPATKGKMVLTKRQHQINSASSENKV